MYSLSAKLALSAESWWGIAFKTDNGFQVYQQSLFWLACNGINYDNSDLKLNLFMGSGVISCHFSFDVIKNILDKIQVLYFLDENQIRWILPHNISPIFYAQWKYRVTLDLYEKNI